MKRLTIRIGPALLRQLEGLAEDQSQPVSAVAREAIEDGLTNDSGRMRELVRLLEEVRSLQIVSLASLFSMPGLSGREFSDVAGKAKDIAQNYRVVVAAGEVDDE